MTASVVSIRGEDYATPDDCVAMPDDLRELADKIESGEYPADRGLLVYQTRDKRIRHIAIGAPLSLLEATGLLAWSIEDIKNR